MEVARGQSFGRSTRRAVSLVRLNEQPSGLRSNDETLGIPHKHARCLFLKSSEIERSGVRFVPGMSKHVLISSSPFSIRPFFLSLCGLARKSKRPR